MAPSPLLRPGKYLSGSPVSWLTFQVSLWVSWLQAPTSNACVVSILNLFTGVYFYYYNEHKSPKGQSQELLCICNFTDFLWAWLHLFCDPWHHWHCVLTSWGQNGLLLLWFETESSPGAFLPVAFCNILYSTAKERNWKRKDNEFLKASHLC